MVPSFEESTPVPAVAVVTPEGRSTGGRWVRHAASQAFFDFSV
jgi:hypothetical protein